MCVRIHIQNTQPNLTLILLITIIDSHMRVPLLITILLSTINNLPLYLTVKQKISFYITLHELFFTHINN